MSHRAWLPSSVRRSALNVARIGLLAALVPLAACAVREAPTAGTSGNLFARGLDEITDLYIEPVSVRQVALAGAARLSRLDDKLSVSETAQGSGATLILYYGGHETAMFPIPPEGDTHGWSGLLDQLVAAAQGVSPNLAGVTKDAVAKTVFDGMTAALDRFSRYASPEMASDQRAARDGFGGIGLTLDPANDGFRVAAVSPQGPAARAGIRPEDTIVAIDGVPTAGRSHAEVVHQLRGPVTSAVALRVARDGLAQARDFHLQRALVVVPTVTISRNGEIAVFHIASFNQSTTQRLAEGLAEARRQAGGKLGGIVLDLRGNPGGLLDQAVSLADLFIHDGPIVATVGRHPAARQYFGASGRSIAPQTPLAVLINGGSASSSEIVAASLQDAGRAVVIGSSSYGKGTVQTVLRLPNDGELTLTWARLVAPAGYYLQTHGVVPTICTADLADDEASLQVGLQRASAAAAVSRARAKLDERAWSELRQTCPAQQKNLELDVKLAQRVLSDSRLYTAAIHGPGGGLSVARSDAAPAAPSDRALTEVRGALSSGQR